MKNFDEILKGYKIFRYKYAHDDKSVMQYLSEYGQQPEVMVVSCCDSRVDPGLILQCDPGDLFIARNVANIIPPYEPDKAHHGTSAALEFGICYLNVKHLIVLGHSQCGGIQALMSDQKLPQNDFIGNWMGNLNKETIQGKDIDHCSKQALLQSKDNCYSFPWIKSRIDDGKLKVHLWFFDIKEGKIQRYDEPSKKFTELPE